MSLYVCVCNAVTESDINNAIDEGLKTVKALSRELGVGKECGACVSCAKDCLAKANKQQSTLPKNVFPIIKQEAA